MGLSDILLIILSGLISIALFIYGLFAVFKTQQLIDYNLSVMRKSRLAVFGLKFQERISRKKWYYLNIKFCGVLVMLVSLLIMFAVINAFIKH